MKRHAPNLLINQPDNVLLLSKPLILMMRKLLLLLMFAVFATDLSAQVSKNSNPGVMEAKAFIAYLRANEQSTNRGTLAFSQAKSLEDLLYNIQSSQYLSQGTVKTYGEKPRHLFVDVQSLNALNNPSLLKNNIDIVTIRINSASDLNATIDLSLFSSFVSLKYVHIASSVPAQPSNLSAMVVHPEDRLSVFYTVENGERNQ